MASSKARLHGFVPLLLTLALLVAAVGCDAPDADASSDVEPFGFRPGELVPDLPFTDMDGAEGTLAQYRGTPAVVIAVRDTGCPVSGRYAPRLARMEAEWAAEGVEFIWLNPGPHESEEDIRAEIEEFGFQGRYIHDPEGAWGRALQIRATTEVLVLDESLTLVYRGSVDDQYGVGFNRPQVAHAWMEDALQATLAGTLPTTRMTEEVHGCVLGFDRETPVEARQEELTWHNRASRVVQQNCVACHREGGIAPFSLETYEQVFGYRAMLTFVVEEGIMPPWYADPGVGKWANDRSISESDRRALLDWIASGAPEGDPVTAVAHRNWAEGWNIGEPDLVLEFGDAITIPAEGVVPYQYVVVPTNFEEDRWIRKLEIRPSAPEVTHHALVFVQEPGQETMQDGGVRGFFAATAPGAVGDDFGEALGKRIPAGSSLVFQMHYTPNGREVEDRTRIGFVFHDEPPAREVETRSAFNVRFVIPPYAENHEVAGEHAFREDGEIRAFFPHTHVRGVAFRYDLVRADGTDEVVLNVPNYNFDWQLTYTTAEPIRVRAGDVLRATAWYDNSANNPYNPDPSAEVRFGEQTWDEMMLGYFDFVASEARVVAQGN
ncbi:MAG: redoxin [Gemmatimonadales bacterium]|nr:MAG: redoxin [Gemmatimonadales bacterium]